jgi:ubiquitin carboxyl-terminal hydrolase 36/42
VKPVRQNDAGEFFEYLIKELSVNTCISNVLKVLMTPTKYTIDYSSKKGHNINQEEHIMENTLYTLSLSTQIKKEIIDNIDPIWFFDTYTTRCQSCKEIATISGGEFINLPDIIVIELGREKEIKGSYVKDSRRIKFYPEQTFEYVDDSIANYKLFANIVHKGKSMNEGHYFANILDSRGNWECFDDEEVTYASDKNVFECCASMLFYKKIV